MARKVGDRVRFSTAPAFGAGTIIAIDGDPKSKPYVVKLDAPVKAHREGRDQIIDTAYGSDDICIDA